MKKKITTSDVNKQEIKMHEAQMPEGKTLKDYMSIVFTFVKLIAYKLRFDDRNQLYCDISVNVSINLG